MLSTCASGDNACQMLSSFCLELPRMGVRMKPGSTTLTCELQSHWHGFALNRRCDCGTRKQRAVLTVERARMTSLAEEMRAVG